VVRVKNYYEILEISELASADEIKKQYRKLMMKYHPDRHNDNPLIHLAEREVKKYQEAYEIIGNKDKRVRYDLELKKSRFEKMNPSVNHRDPAPPRSNPEPDHAAAAEEKNETDYDPEEEYEEYDETE
jgi:curved DNA-binding protein CbpA